MGRVVEAVLPALIALLLAVLDVYSVRTALWIAIIANGVLLLLWGVLLRRHAGGSALEQAVAGLTTAAFGLVLIALKALVH